MQKRHLTTLCESAVFYHGRRPLQWEEQGTGPAKYVELELDGTDG